MPRIVRTVPFALLALLALVASPATGKQSPAPPAPRLLDHLSQAVQARQRLADVMRAGGAAAAGARSLAATQRHTPAANLFNLDDVGLPQNEESVTVCRNRPNVVVGGANDYRFLLDPQRNSTGWYFSNDGGRTVAKEGLLPALPVGGRATPSGGDPVTQSDDQCRIYAGSLNFDPQDAFGNPSGIGVYRTTPEILARCPAGEDPDRLTNPSCWPVRRPVAETTPPHFLDKEWLDVGRSGSAGEVVWIAYSDFTIDPNAPVGFTGAQIKAVRCDADLTTCTQPILISGTDQDIQFADVTIAADGRTLITWISIQGELEQTAQTFTVKARVAPAGSTAFGPTHVVDVEKNPLPFGGRLHANDFRTATYPKSIMPIVGGRAHMFVTWERCRYRLLDNICEEAEVVLSRSTDDGRTWSTPRVISAGGDNYFPAISDEVGGRNFVVAYYTNRFDPIFHNRQDVELVTLSASSGAVLKRQRVTRVSDETEADPLLGGGFIGDYFDVHLLKGLAYVHYNANYRSVRVLGQGLPVPQQDNFLTVTRS